MRNQTFTEHVAHKVSIFQQALDESGINCLFIASGSSISQFRDDINYPFKTNPYFKEFLPLIGQPDCFLQLDRDNHTPRLFIKEVDDFWHSSPTALKACYLTPFDVQPYHDSRDLASLKQHKSCALISPDATYPAFCPTALINPEPLLTFIDYYRATKTRYELDCIRRANATAVKGHRAAKAAFLQGKSEQQIHLDYLQASGQTESQIPYPNIVALNQHAAVLHHTLLDNTPPGNTSLKNRQASSNSLLIDAGASFNGYASDITRTYCAQQGEPIFEALINGIDHFQKKLVDGLRVGDHYTDTHLSAHQYVAELLCELGIIRVTPQQAVDEQITSTFFPHGVGHLLGLQVHDRGGHLHNDRGVLHLPPKEHPFLRCTRIIAENMVFTVEPGVYFIPSLLDKLRRNHPTCADWSLIEQLRPYGGARIEDNIVVSHSGVENITRQAFSQEKTA